MSEFTSNVHFPVYTRYTTCRYTQNPTYRALLSWYTIRHMTQHTFTQKEVFTSAWNKVQEHGWFLFTVYFLAAIFLCSASFGPIGLFLFNLGVSAKVIGITELLLKFVLYYIASIAVLNTTLKMVKDNRAQYEDLVTPFKTPHAPLTYTATSLIFTIILVLCFAALLTVLSTLSLGLQPGALFTAKSYLVIIGTSLLLLVGAYYAMRLMFYKLFILDNSSIKAIDALKHSFSLTQGHNKSLITFSVLSIVFNTIGMLAFGLGLIITIPITVTAYAAIYKKLAHHE